MSQETSLAPVPDPTPPSPAPDAGTPPASSHRSSGLNRQVGLYAAGGVTILIAVVSYTAGFFTGGWNRGNKAVKAMQHCHNNGLTLFNGQVQQFVQDGVIAEAAARDVPVVQLTDEQAELIRDVLTSEGKKPAPKKTAKTG